MGKLEQIFWSTQQNFYLFLEAFWTEGMIQSQLIILQFDFPFSLPFPDTVVTEET